MSHPTLLQFPAAFGNNLGMTRDHLLPYLHIVDLLHLAQTCTNLKPLLSWTIEVDVCLHAIGYATDVYFFFGQTCCAFRRCTPKKSTIEATMARLHFVKSKNAKLALFDVVSHLPAPQSHHLLRDILLSSADTLTRLTLPNTHLPNLADNLHLFTNLKQLSLPLPPTLHNPFPALPALKYLDLSHSRLPVISVAPLSRCINLRVLCLRHIQLLRFTQDDGDSNPIDHLPNQHPPHHHTTSTPPLFPNLVVLDVTSSGIHGGQSFVDHIIAHSPALQRFAIDVYPVREITIDGISRVTIDDTVRILTCPDPSICFNKYALVENEVAELLDPVEQDEYLDVVSF